MNSTDQCCAPTIELEVIQCNVVTVSIDVAVAVFDAQPCSLDCCDFSPKFMLCVTVGMDRWNL